MIILENYETRIVKGREVVHKYPDGEIVVDEKGFLYVYYRGTMLLRMKHLERAHITVVPNTTEKYGFVDGAADGDMYNFLGWCDKK